MNTSRAAILLCAVLFAGSAVLTTPARADPPKQPWSDAAFLSAARCAGLAQGSKLDTNKIDAALKSQGDTRMSYVSEQAETARSDAARRAQHASPTTRQSIDAELAGPCQAYLRGDS